MRNDGECKEKVSTDPGIRERNLIQRFACKLWKEKLGLDVIIASLIGGPVTKAHLDRLLACLFWKSFSPISNILSPYHPQKSPTENPYGKKKKERDEKIILG